nr:ABC transporter substrate-binding protein [Euzebyales bacterium]
MRSDNKFSRWRWLAVMAVLAMVAAACGGSPSGEGSEAGGSEAGGSEAGGSEAGASEPAEGSAEATETMVFGTSADPLVLDGALVSDGESLRAIDQMFEGLVTLEPGGTEVVPGLATDWEVSDNGQSYTFTLQEGVTFHDGEPFNAEAVCFNFDRWYNFEGSFQNPAATYYWQTVFGGFAETDPDSGAPEDSLFDSCEATSESEVTINLTKPSASFLPAMALTNFTIASPAALEEFNADEGRVNAEDIFNASGTYGTEHPTGTGPFMFSEWIRGDRLVMERNPDYWGDAPGNIGTLIFRPTDPAAQLQALQTGEINGYDLVSPEDFGTIEGDDQFQLLTRPAFNIGYVGINQATKPLDDIEVRKAIAHAINRQEVVDGFYGGQGVVATQFMPPEVFGYADDVTEYEYDPEMSKQILTDAG